MAGRVGDFLLRVAGWRVLLLFGDPCVLDRWRWLRRHLRPGPLRTLDAGSGSGALTLYAAHVGNEAVGISFEPANNRKAARRAAALRLTARFLDADLRALETMRGRLGTFDQVICFETLEHIRDDRKLLADLAALLRPGGRLLLTTPSSAARPLPGDRISAVEDGGHVRRGYTHEELRTLLAATGLTVIREDHVSGFVSQRLTALLRVLARIHPEAAWLLTLPLRPLQLFDAPLTRWLAFPHLSVAVLAEKHTRADRLGI